ncbi:class I SAM-dependent RNA methyltransferase [Jannaschia sp. W003]|uniref:class I SAM-dependent RNA methyltransferase n=1 Tax=Jannaschia sp. W003 TaxID=2867012 RepID=UPI0021A5CDAD|nr:class I SAM-dependent RNA methyltransferase [Jannaschia sp. W003]UWQ22148.1 class I SAM-dependent RNA methyltransferase [Jannaschia sp. W003]
MSVVIERLDARGAGVAGDVVVPRTLPGERVDPDGRPILEPSPERVAPPCPHFRRCGGCALQHASDRFVARWKAGRVRDALVRAGLEPEMGRMHVSPPASRRRAALKGRKTKRGAEVGLHTARTHDLVAIPDCRVLVPAIVAALPALERLTRLAAPRGGEVGLHVTATAGGLDLAVTDAKAVEAAMLAPFAADFARVTWNGEPLVQSAPPVLALGPARVVPPPGAFLQATVEGERALVALVREALGDAARVADLFSGLGTFTFPAALAAPVDAFEAAPELVDALRAGARHAPGTKAIAAHRRDLFREPLLPEELRAYDAVVIDPPRAGAAAQVAELARSEVRVVAHVSCNPATFARDAAALVAGGYRMGPVSVVDQFRWSPHVELFAAFRRET